MSEELTTISAEKKALYRRMYAPSATDSEFETFIALAQTYNLRPELHEIWCIKYGGAPAQIFAGRDGLLSLAHKTGKFDGMQTETNFDEKGNLISATCKIWRNDMSHEFTRTVYLKEYTTGRNLWASKPISMLSKVAESQCLRLAFSVSGLYDESEFGDVKPTKYNQEGAIDVEPENAEPAMETYDYNTAMKVKENMEFNQGMNTDIFEKARLPDGRYNKQMITDDFNRQKEAKKAEAKPEAKPAEQKPVVNQGLKQMLDAYLDEVSAAEKCEKCGIPLSTAEKQAGNKVCQKCLQ